MQNKAFMTEPWQRDVNKPIETKLETSVPTLIVEEMFGVQKAHRCLRMSNRIRKPEGPFVGVIKSGLMDSTHKWKPQNANMPLGAKTAVLKKECFQQPPEQSIVGTSPVTPYYSPLPTASPIM